MKEREERKLIPPYIAFKTLGNFLERLKVGVPHRVDKSLMNSYSGAIQSQLLATLKYLGLITDAGNTTEKLQKLVNADENEKKQVLIDILKSAYPFLFKIDFDLKKTTLNQLQEHFVAEGTSGDTTRKCMAFFMSAAKEAGIELSPHLKIKSPRGSVARKAKKANSGNGGGPSDAVKPPLEKNTGSGEGKSETWQQALLSKFPTFDPAWGDDVKNKWFDAFKDLMEIKK